MPLNNKHVKALIEIEKQAKAKLQEWRHYKVWRGKLWWMDLSDLKIRDLSPLANLVDLEYLNLSGFDKIKNFDIIARLKKLKYLDLSWTNVNDLSFLSELKELRVLKLRGCRRARDLTPLVELENLEALDLVGCLSGLRDISPLIELRRKYNKLKEVSLGGSGSFGIVFGNGIVASMYSVIMMRIIEQNFRAFISPKFLYQIYALIFLCAFLIFGVLIPTLYGYLVFSIRKRIIIMIQAPITYVLCCTTILSHYLSPYVAEISTHTIIIWSIFMTVFSALLDFLMAIPDRVPKCQILELQALGVRAERVVRGIGNIPINTLEKCGLITTYGERSSSMTNNIHSLCCNILFDKYRLRMLSFLHFPLIFITSIMYLLGSFFISLGIILFLVSIYLLPLLILIVTDVKPTRLLNLIIALFLGIIPLFVIIDYTKEHFNVPLRTFYALQPIIWIPTIGVLIYKLHKHFFVCSPIDLHSHWLLIALSIIVAVFILVGPEHPETYIFSALWYLTLGVFLWDVLRMETW